VHHYFVVDPQIQLEITAFEHAF